MPAEKLADLLRPEYIYMHPDHDFLAGLNLPEPDPLFTVDAPNPAGPVQ